LVVFYDSLSKRLPSSIE